MRSDKFRGRGVWYPDITVTLGTGKKLVIEYDGAYWHADKATTDERKTRDLLAAGLLVARLREDPLPMLNIVDDSLIQLAVSARHPDPDFALGRVNAWVQALELAAPASETEGGE